MEQTSTLIIYFESGKVVKIKNRTQTEIDLACKYFKYKQVRSINNLMMDFKKVECISIEDTQQID